MSPIYKSLLHQMTATTATEFWNDSCAEDELIRALDHGAVGATSNPVIVANVLKKEFKTWHPRLLAIMAHHPAFSEIDLAWKIAEEVTTHGARLLYPTFEASQGLKGRLSIQVDPANYRNAAAMLAQAEHFYSLAPNLQIKLPVTHAGIQALEEATWRGINITATVCFTVSQAVAVAEAVERGLKRRAAQGKSNAGLTPVCAFMIGRTDDWMRVLHQRDRLDFPQEYCEWAGIACLKKTYAIYQARGYKTRLLAAAYRNLWHWSELVGADLALTITREWQDKINLSGIEVRQRIADPVRSDILEKLYSAVPDFRLAYDEHAIQAESFETYGATARTLRAFIASFYDLVSQVRDVMLPNPDGVKN
jgi:transaldolase